MAEKFYITTTLPYVNAPPHIGFALELVQADIIARYRKLMGADVVFNTGTDEHGLKIYRKAVEAGKEPQTYVDEYAAKFERLTTALNVGYTKFIRTTDPHHVFAAQEFWKRCRAHGDIEKRLYGIKYCVGCELEKTDSELTDGRCSIHPNLFIEEIKEENYFFKFSNYQQPLLDLYAAHSDFVVPDFRFREIQNFVASGLQDFSVSRLKTKMPWGVPVPGDENHVMYVWFDALVNYISTLGWPSSAEDASFAKVVTEAESESKPEENYFAQFWGTKERPNCIQIAGKDNLRQQSAMWQAMLMSAGLPNSKQILIHGFINSGGEKMSKSLGNVVDPIGLIERINKETNSRCGTDALRFWFAHDMPTFGDGDFTWEGFRESYNAHLANGLGNLVSRVMKMTVTHGVSWKDYLGEDKKFHNYPGVWDKAYDTYDLKIVIDNIWEKVQALDVKIQLEEPFKKIKVDEAAAKKDIAYLLSHLLRISYELEPFLPKTSLEIRGLILESKVPERPLFPRLAQLSSND